MPIKFDSAISITPSEVIEYIFCPRFTYFMNCLDIPQHEETRYKVLKGRELHERKAVINKDYFRRKIGCVKKEILVYLNSDQLHIRGIIDEVLTLSDGTMAPLDYKFAEYKDFLYATHKIQSALYGLLIKENYGAEVNRGYLCYLRSDNLLKEIQFTETLFAEATQIVNSVLEIIARGYYPKRTKFPARCIDCCYKNICV
jgi:CRISPR-associated exonuclease Cas4